MHRRELSFICTTHRWDDRKMMGRKTKREELGPPKIPSPHHHQQQHTMNLSIYENKHEIKKWSGYRAHHQRDRPDLQHSSLLLLLSTYSYRYYSSFPAPSTQTREKNARRESYARQHDEFQEIPTVASRTTQHTTSHHRPDFFGFVVRIQRGQQKTSAVHNFFFLPPLIYIFFSFLHSFFPSSSSTSSRSSSSVVFFGSTYLFHSHTIFFAFFFIIYIYFLSLFQLV